MGILEAIQPFIVPAILAVFGFIGTYLVKKGIINKETKDSLHLDVSGVVTEVYNEYVRATKEASADGKLTDEEKAKARELALGKLKAIGKEKGIDYAKKYGIPAIMALVEKYVQANKAK